MSLQKEDTSLFLNIILGHLIHTKSERRALVTTYHPHFLQKTRYFLGILHPNTDSALPRSIGVTVLDGLMEKNSHCEEKQKVTKHKSLELEE